MKQIKIRTFATRNRKKRLSENDRLGLQNKRKKSFGESERIVTFANPNGRVLLGAKEVEAKAILADRK